MSSTHQVVQTVPQALSRSSHSEMGQREEWNRDNPAVETYIVKDLRTTELVPREYRNTRARFYRLGNAMRLQPHLSELPPGHRSVNHRHTTEAVLYIVRGRGHTIVSWDGREEERIDWEEGDLIGWPTWMYHQHFNDSDTEVVRYLAIQDTFTVKALGLHQIEKFPDPVD